MRQTTPRLGADAPRSLAAAASPALAGALFAAGYQAWPLFICGQVCL
jgi:hypothetical protein